MSVGRRSATCSSTVTSATTDRSQIRRPTPRLRKPRAIRSTVTALPRTEGNAKGVRSATRGEDMTRVAYTAGGEGSNWAAIGAAIKEDWLRRAGLYVTVLPGPPERRRSNG